MLEYPVYDGQTVIGTARAEKQGMFYLIRIRCKPHSGKPEHMVIANGMQDTDLGLCVPDGAEMELVKRVKRNALEGESVKFSVLSVKKTEQIPDDLESLSSAYINENGELVMTMPDHSNSSPTGQWSDPMISE